MAEHPRANGIFARIIKSPSPERILPKSGPLTNWITNVYSSSGKEPLKLANFAEQYKDFEGKEIQRWAICICPAARTDTAGIVDDPCATATRVTD